MSSLESLLDSVSSFVLEEERVVTYRWLSQQLDVSSNVAKQLLASFVERHASEVTAVYCVTGTRAADHSHVVVLTSAERLQDTKAQLSALTSVHVYSAQRMLPKDAPSLVAAPDREVHAAILTSLLADTTSLYTNPHTPISYTAAYKRERAPVRPAIVPEAPSTPVAATSASSSSKRVKVVAAQPETPKAADEAQAAPIKTVEPKPVAVVAAAAATKKGAKGPKQATLSFDKNPPASTKRPTTAATASCAVGDTSTSTSTTSSRKKKHIIESPPSSPDSSDSEGDAVHVVLPHDDDDDDDDSAPIEIGDHEGAIDSSDGPAAGDISNEQRHQLIDQVAIDPAALLSADKPTAKKTTAKKAAAAAAAASSKKAKPAAAEEPPSTSKSKAKAKSKTAAAKDEQEHEQEPVAAKPKKTAASSKKIDNKPISEKTKPKKAKSDSSEQAERKHKRKIIKEYDEDDDDDAISHDAGKAADHGHDEADDSMQVEQAQEEAPARPQSILSMFKPKAPGAGAAEPVARATRPTHKSSGRRQKKTTEMRVNEKGYTGASHQYSRVAHSYSHSHSRIGYRVCRCLGVRR